MTGDIFSCVKIGLPPPHMKLSMWQVGSAQSRWNGPTALASVQPRVSTGAAP